VSDAPRAQETGRHYLLVGGHGGGGAGFHPALPLPDHGGLDVELLAHLGQGLLSFQDLLDHPALELRGENPPAVGFPREIEVCSG